MAGPDSAAFDLTSRFGAELVEVPEDPVAMAAYVDALLRAIADTPDPPPVEGIPALVRQLGEVGAYGKLLGRHVVALEALDRSLALIVQHALGERLLAVHTLRHADVLRFLGRQEAAEAAFMAILDAPSAELHDFAWQHLGKLRLDQGRPADAEACFDRALVLRRERGADALIQSSLLAREVARRRGG